VKYSLYITVLIFCISSLFATGKIHHTAYSVSMKEKLSIVDSINAYRIQLGLEPLAYFVKMEKLPIIRTTSIYSHLKTLKSFESEDFKNNISKHLHIQFHYDQLSFHIKLVRSKSKHTMSFAMENVAFLVGHVANVHLIMFQGWKNSPGHWNAMMSSSVNSITMNFASTDIGIIGDMILFSTSMKKKNRDISSNTKI